MYVAAAPALVSHTGTGTGQVQLRYEYVLFFFLPNKYFMLIFEVCYRKVNSISVVLLVSVVTHH